MAKPLLGSVLSTVMNAEVPKRTSDPYAGVAVPTGSPRTLRDQMVGPEGG